MSRKTKLYLLAASALTVVVALLCLGPIPQLQAYHRFCDRRPLLGIPNFANIISNLVFLVAGIAGLMEVNRADRLKRIYVALFVGMMLTGLGSAYYHYSPSDATLIYDRLPMTIVFMSLLAAAVAEGVDPAIGVTALVPLLLLGVGSVLWWASGGAEGDLRPYIFVQYYPLVAIPLILLLFPNAAIRRGWPPLALAFGWYTLAKIAESFDCPIYSATGILSGHTLKHLAAGWATWLLVKRFKVMYPEPSVC